MLIQAGYGEEILEVASENDYPIPEDISPSDSRKLQLKFLKKNKPWACEHVATLAGKNKREMPQPIVDLCDVLARQLGIADYSPEQEEIDDVDYS